VVVAGPLVLARLGAFQWFMRDEWVFLAQDTDMPGDLLEPFGAHWVTLPRAVYAVGWQVVGVNHYWPYQGLNVLLHLTIAVLVWVVARRAGASAWLASAAAALLVLFGPGSQNIVWAFQITINGAVAFGLAHLLLSDHDGRWDRRDSLGLACGVLGLMCSGLGVTMVAIVVLAVLIRRGPLLALAHGAPPAVVYGLWTLTEHPSTTSPWGRPNAGQFLAWVVDGLDGSLRAISAYRPLAVVFALVLVVGMVLAWSPWDREGLAEARARLAAPTALLAGVVLFFAITTWGRYRGGASNVIVSSRYLHVAAALALPALAVGADALARRWKPQLPVLVVLLLVPIPANLSGFEPRYFGETYNDHRLRVLTTAPRFDWARDVPRDVEPLPDGYAGTGLDIGFLLDAMDDGKLQPSSIPLTPATENEFRIRLGIRQMRSAGGYPGDCKLRTIPYDSELEAGDVVRIAADVRVEMIDEDGESISHTVRYEVANGDELEIVAPELRLRWWPKEGFDQLFACGLS
jgi:hypothetical protein